MNLNQLTTSAYTTLKTTPRLRWGLFGILGILWLYGVLELRDEVQRKEVAYSALSKKVARIQGMQTQSEWTTRLKDAQTLQLKLENRLWREATMGLAQATMNDWLTLLTQQANLGKVQLTVTAKDDESGSTKVPVNGDTGAIPVPSDLWKVSARLAFDFNPQSFYTLLNRIATNEKRIAIESLVIRSSPMPRAEIMLVTYFIKPMPAQSAAEKSAK